MSQKIPGNFQEDSMEYSKRFHRNVQNGSVECSRKLREMFNDIPSILILVDIN